MAKIALVDDHILMRKALASLVRNLGHEVTIESDNGLKFTKALNQNNMPEIVLLDINMPEMDGYKTALWIKDHYPEIFVIALTMYDNENTVIGMFKCGARGYLLKDTEPEILKEAIEDIMSRGYFHSEAVSEHLVRSTRNNSQKAVGTQVPFPLTAKEIEFLRLVSTELTYKEIAAALDLSHRTIDSYRDILFEKLNIKSRIGLVLYAIRFGIVKI